LTLLVKRYNAIRIMKTALPLLTFCAVLGILSGLALDTFKNILFTFPGLFVLIPVMIGMGGNLGAILSSRITSALHLGVISLTPTDPVLRSNVLGVSIVGVLSFFAIGILGHLFCVLMGFESVGLIKMVLISSISGVLLILIVIITTVLAAFLSYKKGIDPDDTTIPIVTSVCDVFGILILFVVIMAVL